MTERAITPLERGFDVTLELPGSKSLTNRYLLLAALASGTSRLERTLIADDVEAMLDCVKALGADVALTRDKTGATINGVGGRVPSTGRAFARQSGTTARFIAPVLGLADGPWELDGSPQLRCRCPLRFAARSEADPRRSPVRSLVSSSPDCFLLRRCSRPASSSKSK